MSLIPKNLPKCHLIKTLAWKVDKRQDIEFDFFGHLEAFRTQVSQEVRQINELFPEYTPHDEQYHLKRLFHVADTVLGAKLIESMSCTELYVLTIALYGHDWGMAVSQEEKEFICKGTIPGGSSQYETSKAKKEREQFLKFAQKEHLNIVDDKVEDIRDDEWREYVRRTHAFRSGERVNKFFSHLDGGLAEACDRVCVGHWLEFENLEDYNSYPVDFSALRENINLRALAIYVRLIDLLDLGEDRTPYVIWKFVAPRDKHSKMEWEKHRALQPITCPPYQKGRIVQVDGRTDDFRVYSALQDLKSYCDAQFRGCNDILAKMNDPRHQLDIYHMDWRIATLDFKPIEIQFDFDRQRMFEILGSDIYQGDSYVFLRELLQNSIDAIRLRRKILERNGISPEGIGQIRVKVETVEDGDFIVIWSDDGIGMDEYVVKNYLAVAGKSYYTSSDFEKEGIEMDPISRFGIGILSCFIVANRIEIRTCRERYAPSDSEPLSIEIEDMRRQFRIALLPKEGSVVGTTFKVFVEGKKYAANEDNEEEMIFSVSDYLSKVAGFVEYPIFVEEDGQKTVILNPGQNPDEIRGKFGDEWRIVSLNFGYHLSDLVLPQDLAAAEELLEVEDYDIQSELGLTEYQGTIAFVVPKSKGAHFIGYSNGPGETGIAVLSLSGETRKETGIRWKPSYSYDDRNEQQPRRAERKWSSFSSPTFSVYRDGILVPSAARPAFQEKTYDATFSQMMPVPRIVVNIPQSRIPQIDVARQFLVGESERWDELIWDRLEKYLISKLLSSRDNIDVTERMGLMTNLVALYRVRPQTIWERCSNSSWPVLFLDKGGKVSLKEVDTQKLSPLALCPKDLRYETDELLNSRRGGLGVYEGPLNSWNGPSSLIGDTYFRIESARLATMADISSQFLKNNYVRSSVRFLYPPWEGEPPLAQEMWMPRTGAGASMEEIVRKSIESNDELTVDELPRLLRAIGRYFYIRSIVTRFDPPYQHLFAYGWRILNSTHPLTRALLKAMAFIHYAETNELIAERVFGELKDLLTGIPLFRLNYYRLDWNGFILRWRNLWDHMRRAAAGRLEFEGLRDPLQSDFVPGSLAIDPSSKDIVDATENVEIKIEWSGKSFGKVMTQSRRQKRKR